MTTSAAGRRFTTARLREGYDARQVDEFLRQVDAALESDPPTMRAEEVEAQLFHPVRLRAGYDTGEVDDHLDHLADELRRRQDPDAPAIVVEPPRRPRAARWPYVVVGLTVVVVAVVLAVVLTG